MSDHYRTPAPRTDKEIASALDAYIYFNVECSALMGEHFTTTAKSVNGEVTVIVNTDSPLLRRRLAEVLPRAAREIIEIRKVTLVDARR